jgi:hypothetical protein
MAEFVVQERADPLPGPCVLFMDYNGWWAPLTSLYYSTSSHVLVSRHPESAIEEIISYYCPQCLDPYSETDVQLYRNKCTSCFQCPLCESPLAVVALDPTTSCYQCRLCYWRSDGCNITGSDEQDVASLVLEKERDDLTLESFQALYASYLHEPSQQQLQHSETPSATHHLRYTWKDMNMKLENMNQGNIDPRDESGLYSYMKAANLFNQNIIDEDEETMLKTSSLSSLSSLRHRLIRDNHGQSPLVDILPPKRVKLRTKRMIRCRKDVKENKMSILIQPKPFPLEGDSSHSLHKGKWWLKDSSAVHEIPQVAVIGAKNLIWSSLIAGECAFLHLSISNYKVNDIVISFHESSVEECLSTILSPAAEASQLISEPHRPFAFPCSSLHSSTQSTVNSFHQLSLSAYEDDLLRDEVDEKNFPEYAPEDERQWTFSCQHNVVKLCLPLMMRTSSELIKERRKCGELFLSLSCQDASVDTSGVSGEENAIRTSLRIILPIGEGKEEERVERDPTETSL